MDYINYTDNIVNKEISNILDIGFEKLNLNALDYYTILDLINYTAINDTLLIKSLSYILLLLFSSLKDGSLCLKLVSGSIHNKMNLFIENNNENKNIINHFITNINKFKNIITDNSEEYKPIIFKKKDKTILLFFEKYYNFEQKLKNNIDGLLNNNLELNINQNIINNIKQSNLNIKQKIAVYLSLIKNFVIISGGPGTGKTFIISFLIKCLLKNNINPDRIKLATPTGKSAERITESIKQNLKNEDKKINDSLLKIEGETIHKLLKYSGLKNEFTYNIKNKLPVDVLIIDEVSMVDVILMSKLLSSIPENAKVIFLGDKNQLPSVEAGAVLAELIPHDCKESFSDKIKIITNKYNSIKNIQKMTDRIIILEENYRSKKVINKFADKINLQGKDTLALLPRTTVNSILSNSKTKENFIFIESTKENINNFRNMIKHFIKSYFFNPQLKYHNIIQKIHNEEINNNNIKTLKTTFDELYNYITKLKILTILKEGPYGSNKINLFIKESFEVNNNSFNKNFFSGLPIIITQNNYSLKLFNGDIGIILIDKSKSLKVIFKKSNEYIILPLDILSSFEIAYAITIHKSQGSEYDEIIIILPDDVNNPLLTKEILYTGITRAKNKVYIYGKENVLKKTISNKITRQSGINIWE